jgi:hypothetical protein
VHGPLSGQETPVRLVEPAGALNTGRLREARRRSRLERR